MTDVFKLFRANDRNVSARTNQIDITSLQMTTVKPVYKEMPKAEALSINRP